MKLNPVIPAQAGIQTVNYSAQQTKYGCPAVRALLIYWIPVCAEMTKDCDEN
jgi:hypothetical protein